MFLYLVLMNEKKNMGGGGGGVVNENKDDVIFGFILNKFGIFCIRVSVMLVM